MNATFQCKCNTQRILTPRDLNWVQHRVSRLGLLISGFGELFVLYHLLFRYPITNCVSRGIGSLLTYFVKKWFIRIHLFPGFTPMINCLVFFLTTTRIFFLPVELAKEARNKILTHLTGGWDFRYRIRSCDPAFFFLEATALPLTQSPFCQSACSHTS